MVHLFFKVKSLNNIIFVIYVQLTTKINEMKKIHNIFFFKLSLGPLFHIPWEQYEKNLSKPLEPPYPALKLDTLITNDQSNHTSV